MAKQGFNPGKWGNKTHTPDNNNGPPLHNLSALIWPQQIGLPCKKKLYTSMKLNIAWTMNFWDLVYVVCCIILKSFFLSLVDLCNSVSDMRLSVERVAYVFFSPLMLHLATWLPLAVKCRWKPQCYASDRGLKRHQAFLLAALLYCRHCRKISWVTAVSRWVLNTCSRYECNLHLGAKPQ